MIWEQTSLTPAFLAIGIMVISKDVIMPILAPAMDYVGTLRKTCVCGFSSFMLNVPTGL